MPGKKTRAVLLVIAAVALLGGPKCIAYAGGDSIVSHDGSVRQGNNTQLANLIQQKAEGIAEPVTLFPLGIGVSLVGAAMRRQHRRARDQDGKSGS